MQAYKIYRNIIRDIMIMIDLHHLAYDIADFAHSEKEPTSVDPLIKGPRPFFYRWKSSGKGMDILVIEDSANPETAKLFSYTEKQIYSGVDLTIDEPTLVGEDVVKFLQE